MHSYDERVWCYVRGTHTNHSRAVVDGRRRDARIESNRIESNRIESNHAPPGPSRPSSARAAAYSCVSNSLKDSVSAGFRRTPG